RPVVENPIAVVIASRQERVGRGGAAVETDRDEDVPNHLVVHGKIQAAPDVRGDDAAAEHEAAWHSDSRSARDAAGGGPPLVREPSGRRNAERTVGVVQ